MDIITNKGLPTHIAIIMDGNGRWAQKRGLSRSVGHAQGSLTAENIILHCHKMGIKYLTLYTFSTDNWQRPKDEIESIFALTSKYLNQDLDTLLKNEVKVQVLGQFSRLPLELQASLTNVMNRTAHGKKHVLSLALSYGSWEEIVNATNLLRNDSNKPINETDIRGHLYTKNMPDPDLLIRTSGELRLSNFLLLQQGYTELYFTQTLWPDFSPLELEKAIMWFQGRSRRFGGIKDQSLDIL